MSTSAEMSLPLAALVHRDTQHDMELLLERVARTLQARGWCVGGLVHHESRYSNGKKRMQLFDLRTDQTFELSQDLGGASEACNLNPMALGEASCVLRKALADRVDLVVINRFGAIEGAGSGFAQEFIALMEAGVPVLTAVAERHLDGWLRFTGGLHTALPPDEVVLTDWCEQTLQARRALGDASDGPVV